MRGLDSFQITALVVQTIEALFIGVYFGAYGVMYNKYVSDLLFEVIPYRVLMTLFVVLQAALVFAFICRLYSERFVLFGFQAFFLVLTIVGWITLNAQYLAADGSTSATHKIGTVLFMLGMGAYFVCLLYVIWPLATQCGTNAVGCGLFYSVVLCVCLTLVLGSVFTSALLSGGTDGYVYEHASFLTAVLAHIGFFLLESLNPWLPFRLDDQYVPIPQGVAAVPIGVEDVARAVKNADVGVKNA
jgi:hypothetical protein